MARIASTGDAVSDPAVSGDIRRFSHEAMATVFEVHAVHPDGRYAAQASGAAFDLVDRLERELSRFLPNSDISRVNRLAPGERTRVAESAMECLVIARHVFDLTGGAFDVSLGTGLASLELDPDDCVIGATRVGVRVDLGGIGKGYAVDRMAELLEDWRIGRAFVHGGFSSILALEPPAGLDGWPLTLSQPIAPFDVLARLSVRQTAIGASGIRKGDHILDPRTGDVVSGRLAAWVSAPRPEATGTGGASRAAAVTDALATACMSMSDAEIERLCVSSPGLEAWIVPAALSGQQGEAGLRHFGGVTD